VRILSEQEAVAQVLPSTVRVQAGTSVGSGIVLGVSDAAGERQVVVTNAHVVGDARVAALTFQWGGTVQAPVARVDRTADLAMLLLADNQSPSAALANADDLQLGEPLVAIGYPLDLRGGPSVTRGVFSARRVSEDGTEYVQTDASINPGNSGGPLISLRGQVVGVNTFRVEGLGGRSIQGLGFAVSATSIRRFLANVPRQAPAATPTPQPTGLGPVETARAYYGLVNQRLFPQAWALLSRGFRGTTDYNKWLAGYATTRFAYVTDARLVSQDSASATVAVTIVAVDELNGQYVNHTFGGQWQLLVEDGAWRLDVGKIDVIQ
jgi:S1-C subfamily serine protease